MFLENNEQAGLEEKLQVLQLEQKTLELAPIADALRVGEDILTYVEERQLTLNAFRKEETTTISGEKAVLTLDYNFSVQGDQESLVGILSLLKEHPTASVDSLQFTKLAEAEESWIMSMRLSVFYLDPDENQEQGT